jgi:hypothetical protein
MVARSTQSEVDQFSPMQRPKEIPTTKFNQLSGKRQIPEL